MREKLEEKYKEYINNIANMIFDDNGEIAIKNKDYRMTPEESCITDLGYTYSSYDGETGRIIIEKENSEGKVVRNVMDMDGNLVSDKWYEHIWNYNNGYALVKENGRYNYIDKDGVPLFKETIFNEAKSFSEGYAVTKIGDKYTIIDTKGNKVFESSKYKEICDCHDGYFRVQDVRNGEQYVYYGDGHYTYKVYNYIDIHGNLLLRKNDKHNSEVWALDADEFCDGIARISISGFRSDRAFINTKGQIIDKKWKAPDPWVIENIQTFHDGWAIVVLRKSKTSNIYYNYINSSGELMFDPKIGMEISSVSDFKNGLATYGTNGIISYRSGKRTITPEVKEVHFTDSTDATVDGLGEGFYIVHNRGVMPDYIENIDGSVKIDDVWLDYGEEFKNGKILVTIKGLNYVLDTKGNLTMVPLLKGSVAKLPTYIHYDYSYYYMDENGIDVNSRCRIREELEPGLFIVSNEHGDYSILSMEKRYLILSSFYDEIGKFHDGWAIVVKKQKDETWYNYVNREGDFLFNEWITGITCHPIENGYIPVTSNGKQSLMDLSGKIIFPFTKMKSSYYDERYKQSYPNFFVYREKIKPKKIEMDGYSVTSSPFGYVVKNGNSRYVLKYKPIKAFGKRYIICLNVKDVMLYDPILDEYTPLGEAHEVRYDDNFIINHKKRIIYLQYNNEVLDVADYYYRNLIKKKEIHIKKDIKILSKDEYCNMNEDDIRKLVNEEKERLEKEKEEQQRKEDEEKLQALKEAQEQQAEENKRLLSETINHVKEGIEKLNVLTDKLGEVVRMKMGRPFITVGDHKEINPSYISIGLIKYMDFSGETFEDVKVSGMDFRGLNIDSLNPQKVYPKEEPDLSNCNFEGVYFPVITDFTGVNISGAKFSSNNDFRVFDINKEALSRGIYDEFTTLDGIPLVEQLSKDNKERRV